MYTFCWNTQSSFYSETSGGQNSNLHLNVVHFFNTSVNQTSVGAYDSCFPVQVSNTCCSIDWIRDLIRNIPSLQITTAVDNCNIYSIIACGNAALLIFFQCIPSNYPSPISSQISIFFLKSELCPLFNSISIFRQTRRHPLGSVYMCDTAICNFRGAPALFASLVLLMVTTKN